MENTGKTNFKDFLPKHKSNDYIRKNLKFVKHIEIKGEIPLLTSEIGLILGVAEYEGKTYVAMLEPTTLKVFINRILGDFKTLNEVTAAGFEDIVQDDIFFLISAFFEEENIINNMAIVNAIGKYIVKLAGKNGMDTSIAYSALRDAIKYATLGYIVPHELKDILLSTQNIKERVQLLIALVENKQRLIK